MKIVIVGCGRLGSRLAIWMADHGHTVVVCDKDEAAFKALDEKFSGEIVLGNPLEEEVLSKALRHQPDVFVCLSEMDNFNIMLAQIAKKKYEVPRVLARIRDTALASVYRGLGLEVLCSTDLVLAALTGMLTA